MNHYNLEYLFEKEGQINEDVMVVTNSESKSPVALFSILDGNDGYISRMIGEEPKGNYPYKLFFRLNKDINDEDFEILDGLTNAASIVNRPVYAVDQSVGKKANDDLMLFIICDMGLNYEIVFHSRDERLNEKINEAYFILDAFDDVSICQPENKWVTDIQTDIPLHVLENVYTKIDEDDGVIDAPKMSKNMKEVISSQQKKYSFSVVWKVFPEYKNHVDVILLRGSITHLDELTKYALVSLNSTFNSSDYTKEENDLVQSILFEFISELFIDNVINVETSKRRIAFGIELIYTLMSHSFRNYIKETVLSECEGDQTLFTGKLEAEIPYIIGRTMVHLHGMLSRNVYYTN